MRRRVVDKRVKEPDPKYQSQLVSRFISFVMLSGKRSTAEKIVYGALDITAKKVKHVEFKNKLVPSPSEVLELLETAINHVRPAVEVRSKRVGGATYQVPVEVRESRSIALGIRWIVHAARKRSEKGMILRLAGEMIDAIENKGTSVKKREDTHRMAEANKAFAHFRL